MIPKTWFSRLHPEQSSLVRVVFWVASALEVAACVVAALAIGTYLYIAVSRFSFPFDLEWMEGSVVDHVAQILAHGNVYVEPSLEFTPFIYNPVYYYVSAAVALVTGLDYTPLRAVSIAGSLLSLATIFAFCRRETSSNLVWRPRRGLVRGDLQAQQRLVRRRARRLARPRPLSARDVLGPIR